MEVEDGGKNYMRLVPKVYEIGARKYMRLVPKLYEIGAPICFLRFLGGFWTPAGVLSLRSFFRTEHGNLEHHLSIILQTRSL